MLVDDDRFREPPRREDEESKTGKAIKITALTVLITLGSAVAIVGLGFVLLFGACLLGSR
jgi:hypothetical protein